MVRGPFNLAGITLLVQVPQAQDLFSDLRGIAPNDSMSRHVVSAKQAAYLDR